MKNSGYKNSEAKRGAYKRGDYRTKDYRSNDSRRDEYRGKDYKNGDSRRNDYKGSEYRRNDYRGKDYKSGDGRRDEYRRDADKPYDSKKRDYVNNGYNDRYTGRSKEQGRKGNYSNFDSKKHYGGTNERDSYSRRPKDEYKYDRTRDDRIRDTVSNIMPEDELPYIVMGRNAVREAIKSGRSIDRILVVEERDGSLREIVNLARDNNLIIQEVERTKLDELCMPFGHGGKTGNHQGIVARVPGAEYVEIDDILNIAHERGEKPFIVILDGITDPYNLGSIIRSAECAGAHGIIIPKRRSAGLTASVVKVSAGAVEHMAVARVSNISAAIERLKNEGLWIAGADMDGESMYESALEGAIALVIGAEGTGLSKLVSEKCDFLVSVPLKGNIASLNASVAAAIIMFEKNRQDNR